MIKKKNILRVIIIVAVILLIPLIGTATVSGWNWTWHDFVGAGTILLLTGLFYEFVSSKMNNSFYRWATGIAVIAGLGMIWVNIVGGILGEDNPSNVLYFGIILVGLVGAYVAHLEPRGMSRTLGSMAVIIVLIPILEATATNSVLMAVPNGVFRAFVLTGFFAVLFAVSAWLFRRVGDKETK